MLNVVTLVPLTAADKAAITSSSTAVKLTDANGWFAGEYLDTWPAATAARYVKGTGKGSREERDALLANADVIIAGFPFPLDLAARCPRLKWLHQTPAGASNLRCGDLWGSTILVTTSRGLGETTAIAEYAIAGLLHFAKGFHWASADRHAGAFDHSHYGGMAIEQKTLCVIGAGGIGSEVARLGSALGMRVIGTRANPQRSSQDPYFERVEAPEALHHQLAESDYLAVCCQWTDGTTHLLDEAAFSALKEGAIVVNVARGEIIDEIALIQALDKGIVAGAVLDVFEGEFDGLPPNQLWHHPKVLITPHTSGQTDRSRRRSTELFCRNLERFLAEEPLENMVDWHLGY